jgi:cytochrome P450
VDREFSPFQPGHQRNLYPKLDNLNAERPIFYRVAEPRRYADGSDSRNFQESGRVLIRQMLTHGPPVAVVSALTHPLPGRIIFRLIGFPASDDAQLMRWTANRLAFTWGKPSDDEQIEIAGNMLRYWRYCRDFVAHRTGSRADDLTSELLVAQEANPDELGYREVESVIYGLSFAGHEIVFVANALLCLLPDRTKWEAICANPALIPKALEEVLRFESPQTSWRRIATRDTRIGDVEWPVRNVAICLTSP